MFSYNAVDQSQNVGECHYDDDCTGGQVCCGSRIRVWSGLFWIYPFGHCVDKSDFCNEGDQDLSWKQLNGLK